MSIESFIREIEDRKKSEIKSLESEFNSKTAEIETEKIATLQELSENYEKESKI